jgi:cephalosporin hydroxylase
MINIHQTEHHHTLEELRFTRRLLWRYCCVRTVVTEHLPYNEFIVWSDFDAVLETVEEVLKNYDEYYNRIYAILVN